MGKSRFRKGEKWGKNKYANVIKLEKEFENQNKKLSKKHIKDVKEIVIKSKGNPEEIIRKIENDFGIKFKK